MQWTAEQLEGAAFRGNLETVRWLHRQRCPISVVACRLATRHPHVLEWLLKQGVLSTDRVWKESVSRGQLPALHVLQAHGPSPNMDVSMLLHLASFGPGRPAVHWTSDRDTGPCVPVGLLCCGGLSPLAKGRSSGCGILSRPRTQSTACFPPGLAG